MTNPFNPSLTKTHSLYHIKEEVSIYMMIGLFYIQLTDDPTLDLILESISSLAKKNTESRIWLPPTKGILVS